MDSKGFEIVSNALGDTVPATIVPQPQEGTDVRFVTIRYNEEVDPAIVLNALDAANLVRRVISRQMTVNAGPNLNVLGIMPGSITFEDTNTGKR